MDRLNSEDDEQLTGPQRIFTLLSLAQTRKILVENLTETETCSCVPIKHASLM